MIIRSLIVAALVGAAAGADQLRCDGVLGNSGAEGATLVRYGDGEVRALGPGVDRYGCLWDRAGKGTLLRYAPDGRMLGRYRIPERVHWYADRLAIAGDIVVMLLDGELWTLPIDAPDGAQATSLTQRADALAPTAVGGRVAVGDKDAVAWLDPVTGAREPAGPGFAELMDLEAGADGAIYASAKWQIHLIRKGAESHDGGWPKGTPGEKPQLIDGAWYSTSWSSTIRRHDATIAPAPGVVLGGNTGAFIGHVAESPDIVNGRGLAHREDREWAVGCLMGGICLLDWDADARRFSVVRRLGATPAVRALAVDATGHVSLGQGWWDWSDGPAAPRREGPGLGGAAPFQLAPIGDGRFASTAAYPGQSLIAVGRPDGWRLVAGPDQKITVPEDTVGVAAVRDGERLTLVAVTPPGKASAFALNRDGSFVKALGEVTLATNGVGSAWTSLAAGAHGELLAAVDGKVVVFARDGDGWKEQRRWRSWGTAPADAFGAAIWLQSDGDRLWVSDNERHRVLCFDLATAKPIMSFGETDRAGADLVHLDHPRMIAASGARCVVHDAGNQRVLKLVVR